MKTSIPNILYLHRTQGKGVENVHILGIVNAFRALGSEVDIYSPSGLLLDGMSNESSSIVNGGLKENNFSKLSKYTPELVFEFLEIFYNLVAVWKLSKYGTEKYNLIFERYAIFSCVGLLIAKSKKIPFVLEINYTSRSPLVRKRSALLKPLAYALDKMIFKSANLLMPVSTSLQRELIEVFDVPENKILVLPNAADPASFYARGDYKPENSTKIIGFVGGFFPWHGLDLLVDAFNSIHTKFPEAQVMLVGDGPEFDRIKMKVETLGLSQKISLIGRVTHQNLPSMMQNFYMGVMPDSNDYGSPMKIFEYMASGVPVIAPDYAPILDAIACGKQGLVFKKGNVGDLSIKLSTLLADVNMAKKMGAAGRCSVDETYNWNANAAKILDALERLIPQRNQ